MLKVGRIIQFNFDDNFNGYFQSSNGIFYSWNSGNPIGMEYWDYDNILRNLI